MFDVSRRELATTLLTICIEKKLVVATAESCTGGLVAAAITDIPGSSQIFDRGFVTYSNAAKREALLVTDETLVAYGAVSNDTAVEMATGALAHSHADIAVAVTGIAGPDGGTPEKPVGLVHFACAVRNGRTTGAERRFGALSRDEIRARSVIQALKLLIDAAETTP